MNKREFALAAMEKLAAVEDADLYTACLMSALDETQAEYEDSLDLAEETYEDMLEEGGSSSTEEMAFSEEFERKHPRGRGGEFAEKGSGGSTKGNKDPSASAKAARLVERILGKGDGSHERTLSEIAEVIGGLKQQEVNALKKRLDVRAGGKKVRQAQVLAKHAFEMGVKQWGDAFKEVVAQVDSLEPISDAEQKRIEDLFYEGWLEETVQEAERYQKEAKAGAEAEKRASENQGKVESSVDRTIPRQNKNWTVLHSELSSKAKSAIDQSGIKSVLKDEYAVCFEKAIQSFPEEAIGAINQNTKAIRFYENNEAMYEATLRGPAILGALGMAVSLAAGLYWMTAVSFMMGPRAWLTNKLFPSGGNVDGSYNPVTKRVDLDGSFFDESEAEGEASKLTRGEDVSWSRESRIGTYVHELVHAMDGLGIFAGGISKSSEWQEAWKEEINVGKKKVTLPMTGVSYETEALSAYAKTHASEGFAEFGRFLYTGEITPSEMEAKFPKCSKIFKENGFWPKS